MIETKSEILCKLISKQISGNKFEMRGNDIFWLVAPTQSEIDIYNNIQTNYETLKDQYLAEQQAIKDAEIAKQAAKAQDIINNLPSWQQVSTAIDNASNLAEMKAIVKKGFKILYWLAKDSNV